MSTVLRACDLAPSHQGRRIKIILERENFFTSIGGKLANSEKIDSLIYVTIQVDASSWIMNIPLRYLDRVEVLD